MSKIYKNVHIIYNPMAGTIIRHHGRFQRAVGALREQGHGICLVPTTHPLHATQLAAASVASDVDLIVAAGGDGTINEIINGMVGSRTPLAVLPCGTANVLACETGIPRSPEEAARALPTWRPNRVALGVLQPTGAPTRHFLLMAGAGLDAEVLRHLDQAWKNRAGKLAYWLAGLLMATKRLPRLRVSGAAATATSFALASRVRNYGGDLSIAVGAHLLRDDFELVTFRGSTSLPFLAYLGAAVVGWTAKVPGVAVAGASHLRCEPLNGDRVGVQVDGEPAGNLPADIDIVPDALTLLLPESYVRRRPARPSYTPQE